MASTVFTDYQTIIASSWLNDVNTSVYTVLAAGGAVPTTPGQALGNLGGVGFTALAGGTGAGLIGYNQGSTGATNRTVQSKLQDFVSVKDFGAVGDGTTDDTAAIQSAINSGVKDIYFPAPLSFYKISTGLTVTGSGITIHGANQNTTSIKQSVAGNPIFVNSGAWNIFRDIQLDYTITPTLGAIAIDSAGSNTRISSLVVNSCYTGFSFHTGTAQMADNFQIFNYVSVGVLCQSVNDIFCSKFIINAQNVTNGALGGIRLLDKAEAIIFTDGDVLLGSYSMTTDAAAYGAGTRPAYSNFTNVFFDSSVNGVSLNNIVETEFVGCWFSNGRSGSGFAGCSINTTDSISFVSTRFFNCGAAGCLVNPTAVRTTFSECKFESNSVTAGSGVAHGLQFATNCTDFSVIGGKAHNGLFSGTQGYGIFISGGCDRFVIRDVQVNGNATGPILDGSVAGADKTIHGNIGYRTSNTGSATIAAAATTVLVNHGMAVAPRQQDIMLTRGTTNAGSTDLFASNVTATQFTINTAAAPTSAITIMWMARCSGG